MKKIHKERLLKVANSTHESLQKEIIEKYGESSFFDFESIAETTSCGMVGCKMFLFPILFPKFFKNISIVKELHPEFFGLTHYEHQVLFYPQQSFHTEFILFPNDEIIFQPVPYAKEKEVNDNIKRFIKLKELK